MGIQHGSQSLSRSGRTPSHTHGVNDRDVDILLILNAAQITTKDWQYPARRISLARSPAALFVKVLFRMLPIRGPFFFLRGPLQH